MDSSLHLYLEEVSTMAQNELKLKIEVTIFCTGTLSKRAHYPKQTEAKLKHFFTISLKISQV